ncbi:hypothetical protein C176_16972 [Viridibacillus arenosi FSL R5-213]|uniref:Uncharacterized protein n=1 Tax=Viridibacillus arenosi FSL R5-213 TaxID=1227360 RepID=W4ESC1_9BACL|nr:hypothetical protein C176_16972 [Viridibacillus arenosi FSL R5-213]
MHRIIIQYAGRTRQGRIVTWTLKNRAKYRILQLFIQLNMTWSKMYEKRPAQVYFSFKGLGVNRKEWKNQKNDQTS